MVSGLIRCYAQLLSNAVVIEKKSPASFYRSTALPIPDPPPLPGHSLLAISWIHPLHLFIRNRSHRGGGLRGGGGEELRVAAPSFSTRLLGVSGLHHDRVAYYCMGS